MKRRNLTLGLSALTCTSLLLIGLALSLHLAHAALLVWVLAWAGSESVLAFYGLSWGLARSNTTFFSMFAGGSLLRLASIGALAWIVSSLHVSPTLPLLSLVFAYFLLSLVQLPFLNHGLR